MYRNGASSDQRSFKKNERANMNYKHDELLAVELQIKHYEATLNHKKASLYILERDIEHLEKTLAQLRSFQKDERANKN